MTNLYSDDKYFRALSISTSKVSQKSAGGSLDRLSQINLREYKGSPAAWK